MLRIKYHPPNHEHQYHRVVYMVLTPDVYYLTQYEKALGENRKWVRCYIWEVAAMVWETDEPFVYDFARNPKF